MRVELKQSSVTFIEDGHTYISEDFRKLSGITSVIQKHLFPDAYKGISKAVLDNAAKRGTAIHKACEAYDNGSKDVSIPEVYNYAALCFENNLQHEASEYIISDNEHFASAVDKVYRLGDDEFMLADIKATSQLNIEYVRWQLSIYAYLFRLQNPDAYVSRLVVIWLRGKKCSMEYVEPVPYEWVEELLRCERDGIRYHNTELQKAASKLMLPSKAVALATEIDRQAEMWLARREKMRQCFLGLMHQHNVKSWDAETMKATVIPESTTLTFDAKKFEAEHPELYNEYKTKETKRKESIKLTFRNGD